MIKLPEEGKLFEWRAFGSLPSSLVGQIRSFPVRHGLSHLTEHDIYFISEANDQNVKLRKTNALWVLKFKLLLETGPDSIELYQESVNQVYQLPAGNQQVEEAARLLDITLPPDFETNGARLDRDALVRVFSRSSPPTRIVGVPKVRSQFLIEGGWVELADVVFPNRETQSISIQAYERSVVKRLLSQLKVGADLAVLNYVQACRIWG
ncbi:MAG TPA: hypothetical protein VJX67_13015 [Blastocatellia bacterium]|nr:hypothetical protein [Blastocatellia bacterium]